MHRGFQIEGLSQNFGYSVAPLGRLIQEEHASAIKSSLEGYLNEDGKLDAQALSKAWFPAIKADVFISHSHNDEAKALRLAGWLKDCFDLTAFIDSTVWNSADALIRLIDDRYCLHDNGVSYNYDKRNLSTSHIHVMLMMAITEMIDRCECLFFLNTPESISPDKTIKDGNTSSPWIYAEIAISKTIQKRALPPARRDRRVMAYDSAFMESDGSIPLVHKLDIAHLSKIDEVQLLAWTIRHEHRVATSPLDELYDLVPQRHHL
ncbi:toll/interleukin-1 receptor domain-containing protein [Xanthomonas cerealis pv. cerealis]|uniref:toll/interleukin-1 receptor domain-containing protein n=1 Tax=Xanthomonas TaxID=338 RepID=UPI001F27DE34|nr:MULTISPECIES: toll/interleukin-1 receptor domain-containing protein [Xanthomonas]MDC8747000.1 toll/interleukin-1 receptor domain-containing protein [Xanthomonas campestris]UKE71063.1 toll/interleukin-1 receptor domain-containing protein [Xanthomonas translucens pv. pistacia]